MSEIIYRCRCGAKQVFPEGERAECKVCGLFLDPAHDLAPPGWEPSDEEDEPLRPLPFHESRKQLAAVLFFLVVGGSSPCLSCS